MTAYPSRIAVDEAIALIRETALSHRTETEPLAFNRAGGRVLADAVRAPIDLPSFDNSRMDGVAFAHASLRDDGPTWLRLVGEQYAGVARELRVGRGECVRITTGAPLPEGTDTVAIREDVAERDGGIEVPAGLLAGADVRCIGEDVLAGTQVLRAGQVLTPVRIGLAAALGLASLTVAKRPTVAVFTTGDELVEPGMPLRPGQVYNSNRDLLMGLLRAEGLEPTAWPTLPDDPERMQVMLADAASAFDVVITSGGVSAGQKDHLPGLLDAHGRIVFWKVRMKPGMPVLFGQWDRALFLCLPGNPVSTLATFLTLGRALLDGLQGRDDPRPAWQARMGAAWHKEHARLEFLRGQLAPDGAGGLRVVPNAADASHQLRAAADSNALIVLPEGPRDYAEGDIVDVLPY
ncbi:MULTISPECIES: gephyrin-like molybdotransferase Glp [unclassified Pseudoxanthomonas]|uniref:molybdopterin molybdotransferase MoeA n=1 Tax=unclassified Pseudoxanthomonas TaxID=2645906 RepID=UPI0008F14B91|nr:MULTISPECIES: gephyrin-like molybdotransferase Glp [unclassified Pseudoxanthomonas]PPJ42773.1 molybdopterin molybdenumtransferase MoeA [Pseudoxanthomonas sp. KAs_5_3]SFV26320.1 molybdopterin molybdochelatase [Pseudoxanthomonas sp. YR558]